jgi:hypothetical protein
MVGRLLKILPSGISTDVPQVSTEKCQQDPSTPAAQKCEPSGSDTLDCNISNETVDKDLILLKAIQSLHVTEKNDTDMIDSEPYNNTRSRSKDRRNVTFDSGSVKIDLSKVDITNDSNDTPANNAQETVTTPPNKSPHSNETKKAHKFSFLNFQNEEEAQTSDDDIMEVEELVIHAVDEETKSHPSTKDKKNKGHKEYVVLDAALPAWRSATSHRSAEQKASLRYCHFKQELEEKSYPSWAYGFERLLPSLCPPSSEMIKLVKQHAKDMTQQACIELAQLSSKEKKLADKHMQVTRITYTTWKDEDYAKAESRHSEVITGYRVGEIKKLKSFKERDDSRKPTDDSSLAEMLTNRVSRDPDVLRKVELELQLLSLDDTEETTVGRNDKSQERKRKKPNSRPNTPTRQMSPTPSTSRGDTTPAQGRERSRERGSHRGNFTKQRGNFTRCK